MNARQVGDYAVLRTINEAAKITGAPRDFIRNGCKNGTIPHVKSGRTYLVNVPLFLEQLNKDSRKGAAENE